MMVELVRDMGDADLLTAVEAVGDMVESTVNAKTKLEFFLLPDSKDLSVACTLLPVIMLRLVGKIFQDQHNDERGLLRCLFEHSQGRCACAFKSLRNTLSLEADRNAGLFPPPTHLDPRRLTEILLKRLLTLSQAQRCESTKSSVDTLAVAVDLYLLVLYVAPTATDCARFEISSCLSKSFMVVLPFIPPINANVKIDYTTEFTRFALKSVVESLAKVGPPLAPRIAGMITELRSWMMRLEAKHSSIDLTGAEGAAVIRKEFRYSVFPLLTRIFTTFASSMASAEFETAECKEATMGDPANGSGKKVSLDGRPTRNHLSCCFC